MANSLPAASDFADRLKTTREQRGLHREALSMLAGLAPADVANYERRTIESPELPSCVKLAGALGVDAGWLAFGEAAPQRSELPAGLDVGQRVAWARAQAGLSKRQVSKQAGLANNHVSLLEAGKVRSVRVLTVGALARELHVPAAWLAFGTAEDLAQLVAQIRPAGA